MSLIAFMKKASTYFAAAVPFFLAGTIVSIGGFRASVDYYNIKVNGVVSSLSAQQPAPAQAAP